jgi:hypothetical protein
MREKKSSLAAARMALVQRQQALAVLWQTGDQVLLGAKFFLHAREEILAGGGALALHQGHARLHWGWQQQRFHFIEQGHVQLTAELLAIGQGAAVEDRVAFAAGGDQAGLGQHFQVVAHARLADGENLRQFEHAEGIVGQGPQHIQPQRIAAGLAQGRQIVARFLANGRDAQVHRASSLGLAARARKTNIKKF